MATKFGINQVNTETPKWASWVFRIVFLLTTVATFVIAGDDNISNEVKVRIGVYLKALDMFIYGLSKMFGVQVKDEVHNSNEPNLANPPSQN